MPDSSLNSLERKRYGGEAIEPAGWLPQSMVGFSIGSFQGLVRLVLAVGCLSLG